MTDRPGTVYLVGAGPGDPELLTLKGSRVLASADCVVYDQLANPALLRLAPASAERLYMGKRQKTGAAQREICDTIVARAQAGKTVVRLKGGDPAIFGRISEELEALTEAGIPFEIVPGVTAACGVAAYTGLSLTHRDCSASLAFVSGHDLDRVSWDRLRAESLVIYMGREAGPRLAECLQHSGWRPDTPVLMVQDGTMPSQRSVATTLSHLSEASEAAGLRSPVLLLIGTFARAYPAYNWFECLPLFGQRIVVTRASTQASVFASRLRALGAEPLEVPTILIEPPEDPSALDQAIGRLSSFDWLLFTSVNGVEQFTQRLDASPVDWRQLRARIAAIGPATRRAVEALHLKVDLMPEEYVAESVIAAFAHLPVNGRRLLLPRAKVARDLIPQALEARGMCVDVVEAYRTVPPADGPELIQQAFAQGAPDWITFTSSSTVNHFVAMAGTDLLQGVRIASIGPVTSATIRRHGLTVHVEAEQYTLDGLTEALLSASGSASASP